MKCIVFRCSRKQEMYLYLPYQEDEDKILTELSAELLKLTGNLEKVMELDLTPERTLARVKVDDVIASLNKKSYYLQMPPNAVLIKDDSMLYNQDDSL